MCACVWVPKPSACVRTRWGTGGATWGTCICHQPLIDPSFSLDLNGLPQTHTAQECQSNHLKALFWSPNAPHHPHLCPLTCEMPSALNALPPAFNPSKSFRLYSNTITSGNLPSSPVLSEMVSASPVSILSCPLIIFISTHI